MADQTMMTKEASQSTHSRESLHTIVNSTVDQLFTFYFNIRLITNNTVQMINFFIANFVAEHTQP